MMAVRPLPFEAKRRNGQEEVECVECHRLFMGNAYRKFCSKKCSYLNYKKLPRCWSIWCESKARGNIDWKGRKYSLCASCGKEAEMMGMDRFIAKNHVFMK